MERRSGMYFHQDAIEAPAMGVTHGDVIEGHAEVLAAGSQSENQEQNNGLPVMVKKNTSRRKMGVFAGGGVAAIAAIMAVSNLRGDATIAVPQTTPTPSFIENVPSSDPSMQEVSTIQETIRSIPENTFPLFEIPESLQNLTFITPDGNKTITNNAWVSCVGLLPGFHTLATDLGINQGMFRDMGDNYGTALLFSRALIQSSCAPVPFTKQDLPRYGMFGISTDVGVKAGLDTQSINDPQRAGLTWIIDIMKTYQRYSDNEFGKLFLPKTRLALAIQSSENRGNENPIVAELFSIEHIQISDVVNGIIPEMLNSLPHTS